MRRERITRFDAFLAVVVVLVVSGPMLLTRSGFGPDFTNALWLVWVAGKALVQSGHPTFFVNTTTLGVFYPLFAFYGGPLYAYTGAISELFGGHAEIAFTCVTVLAMLGVYGSILWLGREFGVRGPAAHAPALAALTSAYYVTDLYGRGDWTEFMVISSLAPLVASGVHLVRVDTWRTFPMGVFIASTILFTAGHNITLLWGTAIGLVTLLVMWLAQGAPFGLPYRRLAMLGGLGLVGSLINAWYLLPDVAYATKVAIGHSAPSASSLWEHTREFNLPRVVLDPLRRVPGGSSTPALYVQAPDWFIAWGLVAAVLLLWRGALSSSIRRSWVVAIVVLVLLMGMLLVKPVWQFVAYPFNEIQNPYRLSSFIFYAVAGLVLVGALALQDIAARAGPLRVLRGLRVALVAAIGVSIALCLWQLWVPNTLLPTSYRNRSDALASANAMPKSWYAVGDYGDWQARSVAVPNNRVLILPPRAVQGDRFDAWMNVPAGPQPIQTNIAGGSYLVHVDGMRLVGRNGEDLAILKRVNGGSGPVHVVVETTHTAVVELGRLLSGVALLLALAAMAYVAVRNSRSGARPRVSFGASKRPSPVGRH